MNATTRFLAIDLGAESGRELVGKFDGEQLSLSELVRFPNAGVNVHDTLYWDILSQFSHVKQGLTTYARQEKEPLTSLGVDTWGVDFGLFAADDTLLSNPVHYRDARTSGMFAEAFKRVPKAEIFAQTGIQFMELNTLYQLLSLSIKGSPLLETARTLLMMPDIFNFWLTGVKACEFTEVTTSQMYDAHKRTWAKDLLQRLGIPTHFLGEIIPPGTHLGQLLPQVAEEVGLQTQVIAPAEHDTGSAVAGVPTDRSDYIYISSGTWSLMGTEVPDPIINQKSLAADFTNEGGVNGFRFLHNIMGLWLVQECRRTWQKQGIELSYPDLMAQAAQVPALRSLVDTDYPDFFPPGDMPSRIQARCTATGQPVPQTPGELARCALESLALQYRRTVENIESLLGRKLSVIHIVGGGSQNALLCQFAADACNRPVLAGPVEATAIGNILMQMLATGHIKSIQEGRQIVRRSFNLVAYEPRAPHQWDDAYERFLKQVGVGESV